MAWSMPDLRAVRKHKRRAAESVYQYTTFSLGNADRNSKHRLLRPILEERLESLKDPKFKPPPDLLQLVIDGAPDGKGRTLEYQVDAQIGTGRAALFTTAVTVFHILYDICVRPEHVEPLRQEALEIGEVLMTRQNVAKLAKLDSFIREAQRFNKFMLGECAKVCKARVMLTVVSSRHDPEGHRAVEDSDWGCPASWNNLRH